nr:unnamed protein product [Callosobruchus analis]
MCSAIFPNKHEFLEHSSKLSGGFYICCKCKARFKDADGLYRHFEAHRQSSNNDIVLNYEDEEVMVQPDEANDQLVYILDEETQGVNEVVVEDQQRPSKAIDLVSMEHGYVMNNDDRIIEEEELEDEDGNIVIARRILPRNQRNVYRRSSHTPNRRQPQPKKRHEEPDFSATNYEYLEPNEVVEVPHFKCMRCEQLFINKFGFFRHIEKGKCYINNCDVCDATFSKNRDFFNHYMISHTDRAVCNFCFRTFMYEKNVKEHMLRHLDQFRHRCEDCNKGFYTVREYRNHYKNRHMGIRHKCDVCSRTFADEYYFRRHLATHAKASIHAGVKVMLE